MATAPRLAGTLLAAALGLLALVAPPAAGARTPVLTARSARACRNASLAANGGDATRLAGAIACLINVARAQAGLPPLHANRALANAALAHSRAMSQDGYFSHSGPDGSPTQRMRAAGVRCGTCSMGENIAWASGWLSTPLQIVRAWLHSAPHRQNILDPSFSLEGVGVAAGGGQAVVTQDFVGH